MTPINTHALVRAAVASTLHAILEGQDRGVAMTGVAFEAEPGTATCVPDVLVVLFESLDAGVVQLGDAVVRGAADIVVDVVAGPAPPAHVDAGLERYRGAGVGEYWVVEASAETARLTIWRRHEGELVAVVTGPDGYSRSRVLARRVRLDRRPARQGLVRYRLEHL